MTAGLAPFQALVRERCGLAFSEVALDRLEEALRARTAPEDRARYLVRLRSDLAEFQEFVNLLTVNETYFFREPEHFRYLAESLAPRLLANPSRSGPVRILSAGCSSGEEPYSVAMALLERFGEAAPLTFRIQGGDLDTRVLDKARRGVYTAFSFRGVPPGIRDRHFRPEGPGWVLSDAVRRMVAFAPLNVLDRPYPPGLGPFEVILFRNVSIYFDQETRRRILEGLATLLTPDGTLLTGLAETVANDLGVLSLIQEDGLFCFRPREAPGPALPALTAPPHASRPESRPESRPAPTASSTPPPPALLPAPGSPPAPLPSATDDLEDLRTCLAEERYDEAAIRLELALVRPGASPELRILRAFVRLERGDAAGALAGAQEVLGTEPWSADALLVQGRALRLLGREPEAMEAWRRLVYVHPESWPAHFHLAEGHRQAGDTDRARRAYRAALQSLERRDADTGLRNLPPALPPGEVRFLCEHQLARLGEGTSPTTRRGPHARR